MRILTVARGRPGLGHVTPGLAISLEFARRGHAAFIASYGAAGDFIRSFDQVGYLPIRKAEAYHDWPGLDIYDDGLRQIAPMVEAHGIDLVLIAGEYLLGPLARVWRARTAMLFNPEIMIDSPRNAVPGRLFAAMFEPCAHLVPIAEPPPADTLLDIFRPLAGRLTPAGPFTLRREEAAADGDGQGEVDGDRGGDGEYRIVIGNGGGVAFPASLQSYAEGEATPEAWLDQTYAMTAAAIEAAAAAAARRRCRIQVFSCLPPAMNARLAEAHRHVAGLRVGPASAAYYDALAAADLAVSRAGAGFIADCETVGAAAVIWPLAGHEEQLYAATGLARRRPRTAVARTTAELGEAVAAFAAAGKTAGAPRLREPGRRAERLVDHLLGGDRTAISAIADNPA